MKPEVYSNHIVELYVRLCEYSMVVDRKNLELSVNTYFLGKHGHNIWVQYDQKAISDLITMILSELKADNRVTFVSREEEFEYEGRTFKAKANYILNKKYDNYLEALMAEIEGR